MELRLAVSRRIRELREQAGVTQQRLATLLNSSQSRVAKIEAAANDVSLDLAFRALFAIGGRLGDLIPIRQPQRQARRKLESRANVVKVVKGKMVRSLDRE